MSKAVKGIMTDAIKNRCADLDSACVVSLSRLDANKTNALRNELRKQNIHIHMVKNSLARRALAGCPLEPLVKSLEGPCALVYGDPAITDIARELVKWAKEYKVIELKNGIVEGDPDLCTVEQLSAMKGKRELVGEIAMLVSSPGRTLAKALQSPAMRIAGCLKTLVEKDAA